MLRPVRQIGRSSDPCTSTQPGPVPSSALRAPQCFFKTEYRRNKMEGLMAHAGAQKLTRDQLVTILPPEATDTHKPIAHSELVKNVVEGLSFRHIDVVRDEY